MKKFSFLYYKQPQRGSVNDILFTLKDTINYFVTGETKRKYILDILSQFENNVENIIYRQEVIKDIIGFDGLLIELVNIMSNIKECQTKYLNIKNEFQEARKNMFQDEIFLKDIMGESSVLLLSIMKVYKLINGTLLNYQCSSNAFKILQSHVSNILQKDCFKQLQEIISESIFSAEKVIVHINNQFNIIQTDLVLDNIINKKSLKPNKLTIPFNKKMLDEYNYVYNNATKNIIDIILNICFYLLDFFSECNDELMFYEFALEYYKILIKLQIPYCFPEIASSISFCELYDLNLIISKIKGDNINIKCNDFSADCASGVIIVGANNSGKTVFIKSLTAAQILAQAGLFIPAKKATISLKRHMIILCSNEENDDIGGRFEKEVKAMKEVIDSLSEDDIVIMNEYFQSTNEKEGINILYDVFYYFARKKIFWLAVTNFQSIIKKQNIFMNETKCFFKVLMTNLEYSIKEI